MISYVSIARRRRLGSFACNNRCLSRHGAKFDISSGCGALSKYYITTKHT
jgi:hypothetical protein